MKLRCGECGSRNIKLSNVKGRVFPYKQYSKVKLAVDLFLNVCLDCNNYIELGSDSRKIDEALKESLNQGDYLEE